MTGPRRLAVLAAPAVVAGVLAAPLCAPAAARAALRWRDCSAAPGFQCAVLRVPLDRTHRVPGTVALHVARQARAPRHAGVLVALSGGPGQSSISVAPSVADSLAAAQHRYRIYVLDQRGTGASGALVCPRLQRAGQLDLDVSGLVAGCARRLGPARDDYSTVASVEDLEALRRAVGAPKLALQGISYGTYVAVQYARAHPRRVDRLVLDSVVGPGGVPPLLLDSYAALPRVLRELCAGGACAGITRDLDADVAALLARLESRPQRGVVVDGRGRRHLARLTATALLGEIVAADLNPHLQAALPAAVHSALAGDAAPALRLLLPGGGPPLGVADLSAALNVATTCSDTRLDYPRDSPVADRPPRIDAAVAAAPAGALGPLDRSLVARTSVDRECVSWPPARIAPPASGPLPDVPALVLSGRLDDRTPLENARAVAALLPRSTLVSVPGTGHDETDSDLSGCVARAYALFFAGRAVPPRICAQVSNQVPPTAVAPTLLSALAPEPGVASDRGRVLRAAVGALNDAREDWNELADAGFPAATGGGLRAGAWSATRADGLVLRDVTWAPAVRVTGRMTGLGLGRWSGTLRVTAPRGLGGRLHFDERRGVTGTLGGRRVRLAARFTRGALERSLATAVGASALARQAATVATAPRKR